jgi:hypothetical protein
MVDAEQVRALIAEECQALEMLLISKNKSYGNSFAEPANVFAKNVTPREQLYVRIDDKLNRIRKGSEYATEDTVLDLIGYLMLLRVLDRLDG